MDRPDRPASGAVVSSMSPLERLPHITGKVAACKNKVLLSVGCGFALLTSLLWINEALDLPHRLLGAPATPVNWTESLMESAAVLIVATTAMSWIHRALARIRYLEGLLCICMHCKRIRSNEQWIPIEEYVVQHSDTLFTHGLCMDCLKKYYPTLLNRQEQ